MSNSLKTGLFLFLSGLLCLVACRKEVPNEIEKLPVKTQQPTTVNYQDPFQNNILRELSDGTVISVQKSDLVQQWKADRGLPANEDIINFHLVDDVDKATGEQLLLLMAETTSGSERFAAFLDYNATNRGFHIRECYCGCFAQTTYPCAGNCTPAWYNRQCICTGPCSLNSCSSFRICNHR